MIKYLRFTYLVVIVTMVLQILSIELAAQSPTQSGVDQSDIDVHSWVDRTALFPGDTVTYHVEVFCNNNVDILIDDLDADELGLSGLELINSRLEQETSPAGTRYHVAYELITFETSRTDLSIDEMRVRYYFKRPGQRLEDVASVGEVSVPAAALVLRSTLPADTDKLALRDTSPAIIFSSWLGLAGALGLLLLIVSLVPVGILVSARLREQAPDSRHQIDEVLQETVSELDHMMKLDANDPKQLQVAFDKLERILKEYIEKVIGITATALTASELRLQLSESDINLPTEDLVEVLKDCERVRYGRPGNLPKENSYEQGISLAKSLLYRQ